MRRLAFKSCPAQKVTSSPHPKSVVKADQKRQARGNSAVDRTVQLRSCLQRERNSSVRCCSSSFSMMRSWFRTRPCTRWRICRGWKRKNVRKIRLGILAICAALVAIPTMTASISVAQTPPPAPVMPPSIPPAHVVDLMTAQGSATFGAQWKISDVKIVEVPPIQGAMPQYKTTYNIEPRAGGIDFDDSKWQTIEPKDLATGRSGGHVAFMWYRTNLTIPAKIGNFDPSDAVAVLTVTVDDYAEVWINGSIPARSGYPSPATIQGFNISNRVVLSTRVKAGEKFQVAIFGINGPISLAPANLVWLREARMEFYKRHERILRNVHSRRKDR